MPIKVGINGYGRIGRNLHRQSLEDDDIEVAAINSRAATDSHAYLLKYDSIYGKSRHKIEIKGNNLVVNGKEVKVFREQDPADIDWKSAGVDTVVECTGRFTTFEDSQKHLKGGAKKVIITAPVKDDRITTIVMGVNQESYKPEYNIVSNASCTTNCLAPVLKVLESEFGIQNCFVTTIHAFTGSQRLLDSSHEDFRRSRATFESIIPTTTGAMKAISLVLPTLEGKVDGMAFRIPTPSVSCIDLVAEMKSDITADLVNDALKNSEKGSLKGVLGTSEEPTVSVDYRRDDRSSIVDLLSTKVLNDRFLKLIAWYDNEWGYVARVRDLIKFINL